jgi:hypothetical protein
MLARVKTQFNGCRDGKTITETLFEGDVISGDLARVAIEENLGEEIDLEKMKVDELKDFAASNYVTISDGMKKDEIIEKIEVSL